MIRYSFLVLFIMIPAFAHAQPDVDTKTFERVFGIPRVIPAEMKAAVDKLEPGERHLVDTNNDGLPDEAWYYDTSKRHTIQPMLVRVVDEDGDMADTGRGDLDSDCYFWDHHADGSIDVVTDYVDDDGDNDVDQMGIFYDKRWPDAKDDLTVWWAVDIGDDNKLWYDVNGNYYQRLCQWRTHFGGDELFYQFRLSEDDEKWVNVWEDPFAFYDLDNDGSSEMVIRISAVGDDVKNLRYSIDADDDAYGARTRNYDFSITALPPEGGMSSAEWAGNPVSVRGIETLPLLAWDQTQPYALQAPWGKAMLTWDELNSNTDHDPDNDPNERWEGLLNHASKRGDFEQVGGPHCSVFNNRVEVSLKPSSPLTLQYDSADRRYHLTGANYGYLDVDYNLDGTVDAAYTWEDASGDGILDTRAADVDADGTVDFEHALHGSAARVKPTFEGLVPAYGESLDALMSDSQAFIDVAADPGEYPGNVQAVIDFFDGDLLAYHPERGLGAYVRKTPAGARLYTDLVRDRLYVHANTIHGDDVGWSKVERAYLDGEYKVAADHLAALTGRSIPGDAAARPITIGGATYTKRVKIDIEFERIMNTPYDNEAYTVDIDSLREVAADFNPKNCVVVDGDFRLRWRVIPHQVDDWEFGGNDQLSFLVDMPREGPKIYYVYYQPEGERSADYTRMTGAVLDNPAYVAWESDRGAFRFYTGQFDFFGLHEDRLLPDHERLSYPLIDVNYHAEQDWGIDALHVGNTSGLGGLTILMDGEAYPVQSPAGEGRVEFTHRVLGAGPVRAAVAIEARNVFPDAPEKIVELRCLIYAHHKESAVHVKLPDGLSDPRIAIGLMDLPDQHNIAYPNRGLLANWGRQGDDIGTIGLAVLTRARYARGVESIDGEKWLVCEPHNYESSDRGHLRYWIRGTWRRGMQYAIAPTGVDWEKEVIAMAGRINTYRNVRISAEEIGER